MSLARAGRFPAGTWLLYERPGGLKVAAIVQPAGPWRDEPMRAVLILDGLTGREIEALIRLLGLAPFAEWAPASPADTQAFFGVE